MQWSHAQRRRRWSIGIGGPAGQQGRWQAGADGAAAMEWTRSGVGPSWAAVMLQESDVRVTFYGPVGTSNCFTTSHCKGGSGEIHGHYELSNPSYNEYI